MTKEWESYVQMTSQLNSPFVSDDGSSVGMSDIEEMRRAGETVPLGEELYPEDELGREFVELGIIDEDQLTNG